MTNYTADSDLVLWYPMTIGSGSTVKDYSGNSNDGTINGASWVKTPYQGSYGLDFDGSDDYVQVSHDSSLMPSTLSMEFWIYLPSDVSNNGAIIDKFTDGGSWLDSGYSIFIGVDGTNILTLQIRDSNSNDGLVANTALNTGQWHHIVATFDGDKEVIYIDGTEDASQTGANLDSNTAPIDIGASIDSGGGDKNYLPADLDDVRIWSRALTAVEIKDIYNKTYRS